MDPHHLSAEGSSEPFPRATTAIVCEFPAGAGGGDRLGTRPNGPVGTTRPGRVTLGPPDDTPDHHQTTGG